MSTVLALVTQSTLVSGQDHESLTKHELAVSYYAVYSKWVLFTVHEHANGGADLNGDGDSEDHVLHVYEKGAKATVNLGLAIFFCPWDCRWFPPFLYADEKVVFRVGEAEQGGVDLNGDGDSRDEVVHVHDLVAHQTLNLRQASGPGFGVFAGRVDRVNSPSGFAFHNGETLHAHRFDTGETVDLGWRTTYSLIVFGNRLFFTVDEGFNLGGDLNGDGDDRDYVLHMYDFDTQETQNLRLTSRSRVVSFDDSFVFVVNESHQGGVDLDGNGRTDDGVVHVHSPDTGDTTSLGLSNPGKLLGVAEGWLIHTEDSGAPHVHGYNLETGETIEFPRLNLNSLVSVFGSRVIFPAYANGVGTGHVHDFQSGETTRFDGTNYAIDDDWLVFRRADTLHARDLGTGRTTNLGLDAPDHPYSNLPGLPASVFVSSGLAFALTPPPVFRADVQAVDLESGRMTRLGTAAGVYFGEGRGFSGSRELVAFAEGEQLVGADLNGDGDLDDAVLRSVDLSVLRTALGARFLRGDCDSDGDACSGVNDALTMLSWLFRGDARPSCVAACDSNGDGEATLTDAVFGLDFCLKGTAAPPAPFPECGPGTETDARLGCETLQASCNP